MAMPTLKKHSIEFSPIMKHIVRGIPFPQPSKGAFKKLLYSGYKLGIRHPSDLLTVPISSPSPDSNSSLSPNATSTSSDATSDSSVNNKAWRPKKPAKAFLIFLFLAGPLIMKGIKSKLDRIQRSNRHLNAQLPRIRHSSAVTSLANDDLVQSLSSGSLSPESTEWASIVILIWNKGCEKERKAWKDLEKMEKGVYEELFANWDSMSVDALENLLLYHEVEIEPGIKEIRRRKFQSRRRSNGSRKGWDGSGEFEREDIDMKELDDQDDEIATQVAMKDGESVEGLYDVDDDYSDSEEEDEKEEEVAGTTEENHHDDDDSEMQIQESATLAQNTSEINSPSPTTLPTIALAGSPFSTSTSPLDSDGAFDYLFNTSSSAHTPKQTTPTLPTVDSTENRSKCDSSSDMMVADMREDAINTQVSESAANPASPVTSPLASSISISPTDPTPTSNANPNSDTSDLPKLDNQTAVSTSSSSVSSNLISPALGEDEIRERNGSLFSGIKNSSNLTPSSLGLFDMDHQALDPTNSDIQNLGANLSLGLTGDEFLNLSSGPTTTLGGIGSVNDVSSWLSQNQNQFPGMFQSSSSSQGSCSSFEPTAFDSGLYPQTNDFSSLVESSGGIPQVLPQYTGTSATMWNSVGLNLNVGAFQGISTPTPVPFQGAANSNFNCRFNGMHSFLGNGNGYMNMNVMMPTSGSFGNSFQMPSAGNGIGGQGIGASLPVSSSSFSHLFGSQAVPVHLANMKLNPISMAGASILQQPRTVPMTYPTQTDGMNHNMLQLHLAKMNSRCQHDQNVFQMQQIPFLSSRTDSILEVTPIELDVEGEDSRSCKKLQNDIKTVLAAKGEESEEEDSYCV
ncbi:hypothetical protein C8Q75DRAFT_735405 [Abortiporus biennis]|nr:hypothetical protein C8Q75DRAFT_735405 [Abortiporus biennis]